MDLDEAIAYCMAFGLTFELLEARRHRFPGRYVGDPAAGGEVKAIRAEVARRLAVSGHVGLEVVRDAVEDAMVGRRPWW